MIIDMPDNAIQNLNSSSADSKKGNSKRSATASALAACGQKIASLCVFLAFLFFAPQAFASDNLNLCRSHETPPEVLVSLPEDDAPKSLSEDYTTDVYFFMGEFQTLQGRDYHFALAYLYFEGTTLAAVGSITDVANQKFHHKTWASLGVPYKATQNSFDLSIPDGPLSVNSPRAKGANGVALVEMEIDGIKVEFALDSLKNPAYFFHNGFGQYTDPATGNDVGSNFYYGRTRNLLLGKIKQNGNTQLVYGEAWAERQAAIALQGDVKWTWYSIRLDNGEEIMAYDIKMRQTGDQVIRSATFVGAPGTCQYEEPAPEEFIMTSSGSYTSPHSGNVYPTSFGLEIPSKNLQLTLTPVMQDQELVNLLGFVPPAWHGGTTVTGRRNGRPVRGHADVELYGFHQN